MTNVNQSDQVLRRGPTKVWLPVVLLMGLLLGLAASYLTPNPYSFWRFLPPDFQEAFVLHTVLSTMSVVLLVALAVIYLKVYADTGARFALGITVVLVALLIQSVFQYPLILSQEGPFPNGQGPFLSYADFFTIAAYTLFLYLSLE
jgi:hypothetical protein